MPKTFVILGALSAGLAVAAGAFAAHGLKSRLDAAMLETWETAARYQMYHALALLVAAWLCERTQARAARVAGWCLLGGTLLFSGSLYVLALTGMKWLGAVTPIGGTLFLGGWVALACAARRLPG